MFYFIHFGLANCCCFAHPISFISLTNSSSHRSSACLKFMLNCDHHPLGALHGRSHLPLPFYTWQLLQLFFQYSQMACSITPLPFHHLAGWMQCPCRVMLAQGILYGACCQLHSEWCHWHHIFHLCHQGKQYDLFP